MLKQHLIKSGRGEDNLLEPQLHESVKLILSNEMADTLHQRLILDESIKQVIYHAESTGKKIYHQEERCFSACQTQGHVTLWVCYRISCDHYEVLSAYTHRIKIAGM